MYLLERPTDGGMACLTVRASRNGIATGVTVDSTAQSGTDEASLATPVVSAPSALWPPATLASSASNGSERGTEGTGCSTLIRRR